MFNATAKFFTHRQTMTALAAAVLSLSWLGSAAAQTSAAATPAAPAAAASAPALATHKDRVSYATGVQAVRNFAKNDIPYDIDLIVKGMRDAAAGRDLMLSEKDLRATLTALTKDLRRSMVANQKELAERNMKRGTEFMAAYKARPGVQVLSNGTAYRVLQQGSGAKPSEGQEVIVKYRGTSTDGAEFDATEDGKTAIMKVNQVIMGWREALKQMPSGAKWEIVIPPNLAYGERGVGASIGPNETLVFEVELVGIKR